jgi:hypothetical protein
VSAIILFVSPLTERDLSSVSSIHWPRYSKGGQNMVLQTQGSYLEVDVRETKWHAISPGN